MSTKLIFSSTLLGLMLTASGLMAQVKGDYPIQPIPFTDVRVNDGFWAPRIKQNHDVTIPIALEQCYKTGRVDNFLFAGKLKQGKFCTQFPFDDTDIYKIIEGASYSLQTAPDKALEAKVDTLIYYIGKAQEPDGYLYTTRTIDPEHPHEWSGKKRWEKESDLSHELYNCGHLYEAATAHYLATGKRTLLDIAIKNADLLCNVFGPSRRSDAPGHQIVEMGLVKMYRVTGKKQYLDLAKFFLDCRGKGSDYSQDNKKVVDQTEAVGHAVRATYMYSGMADIAAITGDKAYLHAIDAIWNDVISHKYYITGGIGAKSSNEGFDVAYNLPNMSAYNETCAAIGNVYWNYRLFLLHGEAKYYDVLERTLYNGVISGISLSGDHFFYPNPLESLGQHQRSEWFGCACCPSNICRFIPSIPGYMYAKNGSRLYVNLFINSTANLSINNRKITVLQKTSYPWEGTVGITVNPASAGAFEMAIRIPGWAQNRPTPGNLYRYTTTDATPFVLKVNGKAAKYTMQNGYAVIARSWKKGDQISLDLPMSVRQVAANDSVAADRGKVALQRGPIVYCAEWPDYQDGHVLNLMLDTTSLLSARLDTQKLSGIMEVTGKAKSLKRTNESTFEEKSVGFTAIPYYAWANRGAGEMAVWQATSASASRPLPAPTIANRSTISASHITKTLIALNDQAEPKSSNDHDVLYYHWWPLKDTTQWVQYTFDRPYEVSSSKVYWFDDGPWGGCRIPASWKLQYLDSDNSWKDVAAPTSYSTQKDAYNKVDFAKVTTTALRLSVAMQKEFSGGIIEWSVE
jgi:uncharacterized protein